MTTDLTPITKLSSTFSAYTRERCLTFLLNLCGFGGFHVAHHFLSVDLRQKAFLLLLFKVIDTDVHVFITLRVAQATLLTLHTTAPLRTSNKLGHLISLHFREKSSTAAT